MAEDLRSFRHVHVTGKVKVNPVAVRQEVKVMVFLTKAWVARLLFKLMSGGIKWPRFWDLHKSAAAQCVAGCRINIFQRGEPKLGNSIQLSSHKKSKLLFDVFFFVVIDANRFLVKNCSPLNFRRLNFLLQNLTIRAKLPLWFFGRLKKR